MKPLAPEDVSKFDKVALYYWSRRRTFEEATTNDVCLALLCDYAVDCGWDFSVYMDLDTDAGIRPLFEMMMQDARAKRFQLVMCWQLADLCQSTARETLDKIDELSNLGIRCCCFLDFVEPFMSRAAQPLTLGKLHELVTENESDPNYVLEDVTIRLAERERRSAEAKRNAEKARQGGKTLGRPAEIRAQVMALLDAGKSIAEVKSELDVSLSTIYRALKARLKNRASHKREMAVS